MVDVGSAIFPELDLEGHRPVACSAKSPHVLSDQLFARGNRVAPVLPAEHGYAFFEVEVDRMVPTSAAIDIGPVLDLAWFRDQERNPVGVHGMPFLPVYPDGPRECRGFRAVRDALTIGLARVAVARPAKFDKPRPDGVADNRNLYGQNRRHRAQVRIGRVEDNTGYINALDVADDVEFQDRADARIVRVALDHRGRLAQRYRVLLSATVLTHLQPVHQPDLAADRERGEVDDHVVPFRDTLHIQRPPGKQGIGNRVHHQVSVIGNELERHRIPVLISEAELVEPRHAGIENSEAVFPRQYVHVRSVDHVDQRYVAQEPIGVEDIEGALSVLKGGEIGHDEVDVEIGVAVIEQFSAGQPQIDPVDELLVAAVRATVVVDHHQVALVDVLRGEEEAVIVGPHRALDLAEIARYLLEAAISIGA